MIYQPLSIVVPVKNREKLILRCLDSIYNQSYRPIRLIVVDNDSSDATPERVREWADAHRSDDFTVTLLTETRPGAAAARNRGLLKVDSDYMLFFDSDDVMLPELAVTVMETFDRKPKLDMIYWRTAVINEKEEVIPKRFARFDLIRRHIYNGVLCTVSFAVRTDFIKKAGGWKSDLRVWDDWELSLRLLLHEPEIKGIFRVLVHIYPQKESITGQDFVSKAGEWEKTIEACEHDAQLAPEPLRQRILDMLIYRRVNLAALYAADGDTQRGENLMNQTLTQGSHLSKMKRRLLKFIYNYTRSGGRAAYMLWV